MSLKPSVIELDRVNLDIHTPYFQRAYNEIKNNKYLKLGQFIQDMTVAEMIHFVETMATILRSKKIEPSNKDQISCTMFVHLIAMGEGCPWLTSAEFEECVKTLASLMLYSINHRGGNGVALYDNFKMTGASWFDVFYVSGNQLTGPSTEGESA